MITENSLAVCDKIFANAIWCFPFGNEPIDGRVDPRLRGDDGGGGVVQRCKIHDNIEIIIATTGFQMLVFYGINQLRY